MSIDASRARTAHGSSSLWLPWLAYTAFVIYGSLVPLDFHPRPLAVAWADFQRIRMLDLGVGERADWIANGVLYLPLAFLTATVLGAGRPRASRFLCLAGALVFSMVVAVGVEFVQLFFPPRTVSINDILAEGIGSIIGSTLAVFYARHLRGLVDSLMRPRPGLVPGLLVAYALLYLAFCGFPYDFVVSSSELQDKLSSGASGWFIASGSGRGRLMSLMMLVVETVAAVPLGLLLGRWLKTRSAGRLVLTGLVSGFALGLLIEVAQIFIYTAVSQGVSALTRAIGVAAGAALSRSGWGLSDARRLIAHHVVVLAILYLLALAGVHGWLTGPWGGIDVAERRLGEVHFLPFYYHYFTTETVALKSLVSVCFLYAPIGILAWAARGSSAAAGFVAAVVAVVVEVAKLFRGDGHPDPTNVLLAALAVWAIVRLLGRLSGGPAGDSLVSEAEPVPGPEPGSQAGRSVGEPVAGRSARVARRRPRDSRSDVRRPSALAATGALLLIAVAAWGVVAYPLSSLLLGLLLAACALAVWLHPPALLLIVPAAVPVFDLGSRTGWLMFSEFDLLMLVVWAAVLLRPRSERLPLPFGLPFALLAGAVALSGLFSLIVGVLPMASPEAAAFANYHSHFNALRAAKGIVWGLSMPLLVARSMPPEADLRRLFAFGMLAGMAWTVADVAYERSAFVGLFDFHEQYRVSGPFSGLHVGGSLLEAYLVLGLPFVAYAVAVLRHPLSRSIGVVLFGGAVYALMVTYSRAGLAALVLTVVLIVGAFVWHLRRLATGRRVPLAVALLLLVVAGAAAIPVFKGSYVQARLAQAQTDTAVRMSYWRNALAMIDDRWLTSVFGMGLGRFPETFYWRTSVGERPGTYRFESEDGNGFVRLGAGSAIYLDQFVDLEPRTNYRLTFDLRSSRPDPQAGVYVSICEKRLIQSLRCQKPRLRPDPALHSWQRLAVSFNSGELGDGPLLARPPVKLSLHNQQGVIDIDNVALFTEDGRDLVRNGDFEQGSRYWWVTVDDYWPWHIENLWLHVFFEQGWLGLLSFALLVVCSLFAAARRLWRGELFAGALLASWAGVLSVGTLNSPNDSPQIVFLLLTLAWLCLSGRSYAATEAAR